MENNNNNRSNDFTNWNNQPEQNNNIQQPPLYPADSFASKRRRNVPAIVLTIFVILVGITVGSHFVVRAFHRVTFSALINGAAVPDGGIHFNQAGVTLDISLARNSVIIETHNRPDFLVVFTPPARGDYVRPSYAFSQNGMRLDIVEESSRSVGFFNFNINSSNQRGVLTVFIPQNIDGAFAAMDISTTSGRIDIAGDSGNRLANNATIRATSGRIQAENFAARAIDVRTTSGALTVNGLTAAEGDFTARATSGGIRASDLTVSRNLTINTTSGSINAEMLAVSGSLSAEATSGRINAENFTAGDASVRTTSGTVTINNGDTAAGDFTARTTSGGVRVDGLDVSGSAYANTTSGRINAGDINVSGNLSMETTSGGVSLDNPVVSGQINGRATSGSINITNAADEGRINLSTTSGNITVNGQRWGR